MGLFNFFRTDRTWGRTIASVENGYNPDGAYGTLTWDYVTKCAQKRPNSRTAQIVTRIEVEAAAKEASAQRLERVMSPKLRKK